MSNGFSIGEFTSRILKKTGGSSASNLYAFQITSPTDQKGYTLDKHFTDNLQVSTGIEKNNLVNYQLNM